VSPGRLRYSARPYLVRREPLGDQADDRCNRDPGAGDARHAAHDRVIGYHSASVHGTSVSADQSPIPKSADCRWQQWAVQVRAETDGVPW